MSKQDRKTRKISRTLVHSGTKLDPARKGLASVEARPFRVGMAVAMRGTRKGPKGQPPRISAFLGVPGVCTRGEGNAHQPRAVRNKDGSGKHLVREDGSVMYFQVTAQQNPDRVAERCRIAANDWIRKSDLYQLAEMTEKQITICETIGTIEANLVRLAEQLETAVESDAPTEVATWLESQIKSEEKRIRKLNKQMSK